MKVLVTGAGALLGQGIIKCLRGSATGYEIVAVDPDPRAAGLYWANRAYLVPLASAPGYLPEVERILGREHPDAILVGTDVELLRFAEDRARLEDEHRTHVVVSRPEVVRIADDKWLTYRFLHDHGLPCPASALPEEPGAVEALIAQRGFPLVVKPRVGARSVGVHRVTDEAALARAVSEVPNAVVQSCVSGPDMEYTSGTVTFDGAVHAVVTMRRDLRDGNTYRAYVEPSSPWNAPMVEIARRLGGHGPINFQFRVEEGVPKVFEINARFSGTTPLRALAGFDEVDAVVRHVVLGEPIPEPRLREVVLLKYWHDVVVEPAQIESLGREGLLDAPACIRPGEP